MSVSKFIQRFRSYRSVELGANERDSLMSLLAIVVLCNDRILPKEVDAFKQQSVALIKGFSPKISYSEEMADNWFKSNLGPLKRMLSGETRYIQISDIVQNFTDFDRNDEIYLAMRHISEADKEFQEEENVALKIASDLWQLPKTIDDHLGKNI